MQRLEELGAQVIIAEHDFVEQLKQVFEGVDRAFIIPKFDSGLKHQFREEKAMIEAARKAGVKFVLMMGSSVNADQIDRKEPYKVIQYFRTYWELERYLRRQDFLPDAKGEVKNAILRANVYQEDLLLFADQIRNKNLLHLPIGSEARFAPVSTLDVAQAAVNILTANESELLVFHHRHIYELTGPESLSGPEIASILSKVTGRKIQYDGSIPENRGKEYLESLVVPPDREHRERHQVPLSEAHELMEMFKLVKDGLLKDVKSDLRHLIGRDGTTVKEFAEKLRSKFVPEEEEE
ncbi:uncharacterized protein SPPG_00840 [Spizellomyces punctatus DAOM BR117]|uniref:NmrA-like domain-containing protein n=1 Tax=Spizellomyces punctatus (strain DAOM BR117) TaxID=645134 RepID=A0A0L0HVP1_SPIPD|nr:uncharacterized protein SPPG_00840 [Spizellomyces punctatus DAOM BR117]KND05173.1 hypothetical protein SPPG_00840 [Spizellomyces punctatus DAOM BR117]|eukprot:XP_016613212.1 hypothetical protein SPPG_00840 [Spizellomyces punctatus DAOM BR117]